MQVNTILQGDALAMLRTLPAESVQCIVTSPPYYGLRSYLPNGHEDKHLEFGLEETPAAYVANLVETFREAKRVLKDDGVMFLNLGDSYANDAKWGGSTGGKHVQELHGKSAARDRRVTGLAPKNLIGIPWRAAFGLQDDGWILRSDIIWEKPAAMPDPVKDRPTKSHEYVFLFAKSERYYYCADAIKEPAVSDHPSGNGFKRGARLSYLNPDGSARGNEHQWQVTAERNRRTVWRINTANFPGAHFAVMPERLAELCILAGSAPGDVVLDPFMGSGTVAQVAVKAGRQYLGIELNPAYIELARKRLSTVQVNLWQAMTPAGMIASLLPVSEEQEEQAV